MSAGPETIAAIATPPGRGGVGVLRISGPDAADIARGLLGGALPAPRRAELHPFRDASGEPIDVGIVLYFPAPASFTGEAVLELQGHGGPVVLDALLERVVRLGARLARPGEFSERAFVNGKLDLAQAEAIADLIDSGSAAAARSAVRSLQGAFSERVHALVARLVALRSYIEAAIDFSDEEIDFLADGEIGAQLDGLAGDLDTVLATARQGRLLRDGMTLVIAGPPNAGKSSLLNHFAGRDSAIVTEIPGTTRDVLREYIQLDGLPLHLIDTAGLRDGADRVEAEGIRRAMDEIRRADRVLLLVDDANTGDEEVALLRAELPDGLPATLVRNKIDLSGRPAGPVGSDGIDSIAVSVQAGIGLDALRDHLKLVSGYSGSEAGEFSARRRHLEALTRASEALSRARDGLAAGIGAELVAEELRQAQLALGEITGEFSSDDLLGAIFSSFCIGK